MTERERDYLTGCGPDDFCIIHGYEYMRSQIGNPIPYCAACEDERDRDTPAEQLKKDR